MAVSSTRFVDFGMNGRNDVTSRLTRLPSSLKLAKGLYDRAAEPKKFVSLPGLDHIALDNGEGLRTQAALALQWFDEHLKP